MGDERRDSPTAARFEERPPGEPALAVRGITKTYRRTRAVDDVTFDVPVGRVTAFLGPNGAGKSTTIRILLGLTTPDAGTATVMGRPFRTLPDPGLVVGALIDGIGFHPGRSGTDHLRVAAATGGFSRDRVEEVLETVELANAASRRVGGYSLGMRQRLGLAVALLGDPAVLVLDEPANGLDPAGIRWLRTFLVDYARRGRTVFVSSHVLSEVAQFADDVVVIRSGRLVTHTAMASLVGSGVRVRTPDAVALSKAVRRGGGSVQPGDDGVLEVTGLSTERVGELAFGAGVLLHELREQHRGLEDVFLDMTREQERS